MTQVILSNIYCSDSLLRYILFLYFSKRKKVTEEKGKVMCKVIHVVLEHLT